jgi:uncharacterized protein
MLPVLDQRRVAFETGYGPEADLPDIICYCIQQRYMLEPARANDYDRAVEQGVAAIIGRLRPLGGGLRPVLRTAADSTKFYLDSLKKALMKQSGMPDASNDPLDAAAPGEDPAQAYSHAPPAPGPPFGTLAVALLALVLYLVLWYCTTRGLRGRDWLMPPPLGLLAGLAAQSAIACCVGAGWLVFPTGPERRLAAAALQVG